MRYKEHQQRILACHFPHLPTDSITRQRQGKSWRIGGRGEGHRKAPPLVVVANIRNAMRIVAISQDERLDGIYADQTLSDARAINPQIDCVQHDPEADRLLLHRIARWSERYTPLVAPDGTDGIFADITGCAHLFDGEENLLCDMTSRLNAQGLDARLAIADTAAAAWAFARYGERKIAKPGEHQRLLADLPLEALRLSSDKVRELFRTGFRTIGCLADLPRAPLAARFGTTLLRRLDQALGRESQAISPLRPIAELVSEKRFAEPLVYEDDIRATILLLAENLEPSLERRGLGMRQCELVLFRADGETACLQVEASNPLRDAVQIARLFDERLAAIHDEWDAGFGFDVIRLCVLRSEPYEVLQQELMQVDDAKRETGHLIDCLSARLGAKRVQAYQASDTHIPERRYGLVAALHHKPQPLVIRAQDIETAIRPIVLFDRPEPAEVMAEVPEGPPIRFRWRKTSYEVIRSEGPERIACEWWKDGRNAHTRDYFRVETREGHRLWLFRHGLYERETDHAKWYVHGMFA